MSVCGLHHWSAWGADCPQCAASLRLTVAAGAQWSGWTYTASTDYCHTPQLNRYPECLEAPARAIAANKRGKKPDDPEIDRIWRTYIGQAKACILAFLEESAAYRKSMEQPKQRYVPRGRGLTTPPASVDTLPKGQDAGLAGTEGSAVGDSRDALCSMPRRPHPPWRKAQPSI